LREERERERERQKEKELKVNMKSYEIRERKKGNSKNKIWKGRMKCAVEERQHNLNPISLRNSFQSFCPRRSLSLNSPLV
jgi:hypothetical protein